MTIPLKKQVVSLELAKKMKELGFEQESLWYWVKPVYEKERHILVDWKVKRQQEFNLKLFKAGKESLSAGIVFCSAYTVAELGEMLPQGYYSIHKLNTFLCSMEYDIDSPAVESDTEADARAKMLIYLKENNLI